MSTNIATIPEAKSIAELLVGEEVKLVAFYLDEGILNERIYPTDRFAFDDDGYYLVNANLRVPLNAIVSAYDYGDDGISLELEKENLTKRELVK